MPLMVLVNSCDDKKEIVFDSELPQFEIKIMLFIGSNYASGHGC